MAKSISQSEYRNAHGKRPGGYGSWSFKITGYRESAQYHLDALRGAPFLCSVHYVTDGSVIVTFGGITYGEATHALRHQLRSDRNAVIEVMP
jgi:inosine/xanthosine triphosphate pyrophosphatase family protein